MMQSAFFKGQGQTMAAETKSKTKVMTRIKGFFPCPGWLCFTDPKGGENIPASAVTKVQPSM